MGHKKNFLVRLATCAALCMVLSPLHVSAAGQPTTPFSLEVTPSPLIATVTPGDRKALELRIRNSGNTTEKLKMELRDFTTDREGNVTFQGGTPEEVREWVTFSNPEFEIQSGQWFTQKILLDVPKDAAFSYGFAVVISRAEKLVPMPGQANLQGSVAVFTLLNVDRQGATRAFSVVDFQASRRLYEYLPVSFSYKLKNDGNSIVRPEGNIFIQRTSESQPIAVLKLNNTNKYILPDTSHTFKNEWSDGFPVFVQQKVADNAPQETVLDWDWSQVQQLRFGHYVAKMVAVYNDGRRDIPIEAEVGFWVIPWKIMSLGLVIMLVLAVGIIAIVLKVIKIGRHARRRPPVE